MQAVEALYKSNPEYFIWERIEEPMYRKSIKKLYKEFPEAIPSKCFDNFTDESFEEIQSNEYTSKYPVLFMTYYYYRILFGENKSEMWDNEDTPTLNSLFETGLTKKEYKIIIMELMRNGKFTAEHYLKELRERY